MGLSDLFTAALMAVLKVLLLTALGLVLAIDRVDILGVNARKHLNDVVFFVFNPALVGSKLAENITLRSMGTLWFMPLNILITFTIGSILGWLLVRITRAPHDLRGLVLGCCSAEKFNLPLPDNWEALLLLLFQPSFGGQSTLDYIGAIYMWSYVYIIICIYSSKDCEGVELDAFAKVVNSSGETPENLSKCSARQLLPLKDYSLNENHVNHFELNCTISEEKAKLSILEKIKQGLQVVGKFNLRILFAPSTAGVVVGFIVGIIPQIRKALIGDHAPLHVVQDSASLLGEAAISTITLIVGANLPKGLKGSEIQLSIIIGIIVVRYILLPIFGIVIVKSAVRLGLVRSDPLYQFVLLLQFALPPATNIGTMTQLFRVGESECSVIMLWTYALASVSLTLWSTFFMWLVE